MKLISKKDIIIPKGTIFENIDGSTSTFVSDNYESYLQLDIDNYYNTSAIRIIVSSDNKGLFEVIKND